MLSFVTPRSSAPRRTTNLRKGHIPCRDIHLFWPRSLASPVFPAAVAVAARAATTTIHPSPIATAALVPLRAVAMAAVAVAAAAVRRATADRVSVVAISRTPPTLVPRQLLQAIRTRPTRRRRPLLNNSNVRISPQLLTLFSSSRVRGRRSLRRRNIALRSGTLSAIEDLRIKRVARLPRFELRTVLQLVWRPQSRYLIVVGRRGRSNGRQLA